MSQRMCPPGVTRSGAIFPSDAQRATLRALIPSALAASEVGTRLDTATDRCGWLDGLRAVRLAWLLCLDWLAVLVSRCRTPSGATDVRLGLVGRHTRLVLEIDSRGHNRVHGGRRRVLPGPSLTPRSAGRPSLQLR